MSTTQPIRDRALLHDFKNYYYKREPHFRNYTLIIIGLNTALRINDVLHLTWDQVFDHGMVRTHMIVEERKTGKENRIFLNQESRAVLEKYYQDYYEPSRNYLFCSPLNGQMPLSRCQAYRIICKAAQNIGLVDHISCHSLRKTFGYHAWKQGTPPALLMNIYNHSSYQITKHYLCIEQDDKDEVFSKIQL